LCCPHRLRAQCSHRPNPIVPAQRFLATAKLGHPWLDLSRTSPPFSPRRGRPRARRNARR
jgi:hypothetical protein